MKTLKERLKEKRQRTEAAKEKADNEFAWLLSELSDAGVKPVAINEVDRVVQLPGGKDNITISVIVDVFTISGVRDRGISRDSRLSREQLLSHLVGRLA